jgi:hypothetical protein
VSVSTTSFHCAKRERLMKIGLLDGYELAVPSAMAA